jgi:hypothetical protein
VALGYPVGSMRISIKGRGITNDDDDCYLGVEHKIERGLTNMACVIPFDKMSTWTKILYKIK